MVGFPGIEDGRWADIDGEVVPAAEARISVWDRGFLFGDSVFETVRIHRGRLVLWDVHMERLLASARGIRFAHLPEPSVLLGRAEGLLARAGLSHGTLYIQVTRGNVGRRTDRMMPASPTVFLAINPEAGLPEALHENGVSAITVEEVRWKYSSLKTTNLLPRTLARLEADASGAHEALYRSLDGRVFEGTTTNLFCVKDGVLYTPPLSERLLAGATRAEFLCLGRTIVDDLREQDVTVDELLAADEVILTGTSTEALGVVLLDGRKIGDGRPGPVTRCLRRLYREEVLEKAPWPGQKSSA